MANFNVKSKTGYRAANPFAIQTLVLPDASDSGISTTPFSAQQNIMASGDTCILQSQTGALRRHRIDAERSTTGYIVWLPV